MIVSPREGVVNLSLLSKLVEVQKELMEEVIVLIATVAQKDAKIVALRTRSGTQTDNKAILVES